MKAVELRKLKEGDYFKRKPDARGEFIRGHYNRRDQWGQPSFWCVREDDIGAGLELKPATVRAFLCPVFDS